MLLVSLIRLQTRVRARRSPSKVGFLRKKRLYRTPRVCRLTPCAMELLCSVAEPGFLLGHTSPSSVSYTSRPPSYSLSSFSATCIYALVSAMHKVLELLMHEALSVIGMA